MAQYGRMGIVAPWGLRQYGGVGDTACKVYEEARTAAQRAGLTLPPPPAGCSVPTTTTPTGAPKTSTRAIDTSPGIVVGSRSPTAPIDPYAPPPPATPWYQSPAVWVGGLAVAAWYFLR